MKTVFVIQYQYTQKCLKKGGFNEKSTYSRKRTKCDTSEKKKCKTKVIWFNPQFSLNVKTNVGKIFLRLVKRHFPKENPLHKIFNKNTLKVSYSCMGNVASVLSAHNRNILYPKKSEFGCNCRSKTDCTVNSKCLTPKIVYCLPDVRTDTNDERKFCRIDKHVPSLEQIMAQMFEKE